MNQINVVFLALFSLSALADQTINCFEISKDGTRKANGGSMKAELVFTSRETLSKSKSQITMKGFWKKGAMFGKEFSYLSAEQSKPNAEVAWTHVSFNDAADGEMVEYQLQFKEAVLNESFSGKRANLVIGMENTSSEYYPSWGYHLKCSSRIE